MCGTARFNSILALLIAAIAWPSISSALEFRYVELTAQSQRQLVTQRSVAAVPRVEDVWIVYLPGSSASLFPGHESLWLRTFADAGFDQILVINKAGVALNGQNRPGEFNVGALRGNRIADVRSVLRTEIPPDAKIWLVGESEGAYIAPDIARGDKRIAKLILISAGTRSWIDEEISFVAPERQSAVRKFLEAEVVGHRSFKKRFNGWTYAQLNSYHTDRTLRSLRSLEIPVLMMNGARDKNTWVSATTADIESLILRDKKSNIEFHLIPEVNHALGCDAWNTACSPDQVSRKEVGYLLAFMSIN